MHLVLVLFGKEAYSVLSSSFHRPSLCDRVVLKLCM